MHKKLVVAAAVVFANLLSFAPAQASTQDFIVDSFESNYLITRAPDGVSEAYVREGITAVFPDFDQNHGILRALPEKYSGHSLELKVDAVVDENNNPYKYETYSENDNLVLKIGDPNAYVHGTTKYFIDYHMRGVVSKQADHDEFFWNINGTQWQQPFGSVSVLVRIDDPAIGNVPAGSVLPQAKCYTGPTGSTESNCTATTDEKGVTFKTTEPLVAGENMSVVMAFKKDTFTAYAPSPGLILMWILIGLAIALPPVIALVVVVRNWWVSGRDPVKRGVIVPQYLPPKGETVLVGDMVLKETFDSKAVTATLIDLAVRHYVKVYEVKDKPDAKKPSDYEIELIKLPEDLKPEEKQVVNMLFENTPIGAKVLLSSKKTKLSTKAAALGDSVDTRATASGYFARSPKKAKLPYIIGGSILGVLGFVGAPFTLSLSLAGLILLVASPAMPARTRKGAELRDYMLGLKDYIKLAEADRLKVLQSPHGALTEKVNVNDKQQLIKLYEKLLPYAIVFGLEKDWAKELSVLYEQQPPSWYGGSHGVFHAAYFASAVSGFEASSAAAFASPSSSSGSGFSGGSSGGGGGGGGGGGW